MIKLWTQKSTPCSSIIITQPKMKKVKHSSNILRQNTWTLTSFKLLDGTIGLNYIVEAVRLSQQDIFRFAERFFQLAF